MERSLTFNAERGGVVDGGGVVCDATRVVAAVARRQIAEHQQRELIQALLLDLRTELRQGDVQPRWFASSSSGANSHLQAGGEGCTVLEPGEVHGLVARGHAAQHLC